MELGVGGSNPPCCTKIMSKEKNLKPSKELPLGFVDRQEQELLIRDFVISNIKEVMIKYGFQYLETPSFEYTDSIGKFLPDKERPDEGVFSFKDENKWLSLRYDLTAPLARYVAKNFNEIPKPFKRYQLGTVWRNEKPGPGRYREFLQFDADFIGTNSILADAELCVLLSEILEKCGFNKSDYIIKISNRKIINGLLDKLKINSKETRLKVLRSLDKLDRIGKEGVMKLLGEGRLDKSGDYTEGAKLTKEQIKTLDESLTFLTIATDQVKFGTVYDGKKDEKGNLISVDIPKKEQEALRFVGFPKEDLFNEGLNDLQKMKFFFQRFGFENYKIDSTVIRGLDYYTGPIFEAILKINVKNKKGQVIEIGSVGGGGRYDNLTKRFSDYLEAPATGVSIGLDRLVYALMQKKDFKIKPKRPVVICVFDENFMGEYIEILNKIRSSNISSEIYPGEGKLKKQMEYANKIDSPAVILYGDNEIKTGQATLKNLETGNERSVKIEDLANEIKKLP